MRKSDRAGSEEAGAMFGLKRSWDSRARNSKIAIEEGRMTKKTLEKLTVKSKKRQFETGVKSLSLQIVMALTQSDDQNDECWW